MNEEFAISLKTILDESSIAKVKSKIQKLQDELYKVTGNSSQKTSNGKSETSATNKVTESLKKQEAQIKKNCYAAMQLQSLLENNKLEREREENTKAVFAEQQARLAETGKYVSPGQASIMQNMQVEEEIKPEVKTEEAEIKVQSFADKVKSILKEAFSGFSLEGLKDYLDKAGEKVKEIGSNAKKINFNNHNNVLGSITKKVRQIALGLVGVRSLYLAIRKSMSAYMSQNEELSQKMNAVWTGLGSMLAPVLEWIANTLLKIVSYVNAFVKGLFGVDLLAKGIAQSTAKTAKNQKKSKDLASIDEINNINNSNGSEDNNNNWGAAFNNVDVNDSWMAKLTEWGEKIRSIWDKVYEKFEAFKKWWKELPTWAKVAIIVGIIAAIALLLISFKKLSSTSKGLTKNWANIISGFTQMAGIALILAAVSLVLDSISNLIEKFGDSGLSIAEVVGLMVTVLGTLLVLMIMIAKIGPTMTAGLIPFGIAIAEISILLGVLAITLPPILEALGQFITEIGPVLVEIINSIVAGISLIVEQIGGFLINLILQTDTFVQNLGKTISNLVKNVLQSVINFINDLGPAINNLVDNIIEAITKVINFTISAVEYLINTLIIGAINGLLSSVGWLIETLTGEKMKVSKISNIQIQRFTPAYEQGTNYVPNDQLAMLHEGEAVIPKKYNNSDLYGEATAEELNILLSINEQLVELNKKDYDIQLDGESVAKKINNKIQELNFRNGTKVFALQR